MRTRARGPKLAAVAIAVAGIVAPSAYANFPDYGPPLSSSKSATTVTVVRPIVVRPAGFDWGDAGIGAGAAAGVGLLAAGSALLLLRGRGRELPPELAVD